MKTKIELVDSTYVLAYVVSYKKHFWSKYRYVTNKCNNPVLFLYYADADVIAKEIERDFKFASSDCEKRGISL